MKGACIVRVIGVNKMVPPELSYMFHDSGCFE